VPQDAGANEGKRSGIASGLFVRANPLLITDQHCSETLNFNFDPLSAEESFGVRRMGVRRPQTAGVRFRPLVKRTSVTEMNRWRDGYMFAPMHPLLFLEPQAIEGHIRIEEVTTYPESGILDVPKTFGGLTGRWQNTVGTQRPGGEHQFFPIVSRGAREVERPVWTLGVGVVHPIGSRGALLVDESDADSIRPIFAWWDEGETRMKVSAADIRLEAGIEYHIGIAFETLVVRFWVNGVKVDPMVGPGLSPPPPTTHPLFSTPDGYAVYFGRCYTREPGIRWDNPATPAAHQHSRKHAYMGKLGCTVGATAPTTITVPNQQLAFLNAVPNTSYQGYKVRVVGPPTALAYGRVYTILNSINPFNDAAITFQLIAGHQIATNNIVDIIPPIEPLAIDATIQEVRFWKGFLDQTTVPRLSKMRALSDIRKGTPTQDVHPLMMPDWGNHSPRDLLAYWPMDEGGGNVCCDLIGAADAYFAPSGASISEHNLGSSTSKAFFMDGETQAIQIDMSEDPNYKSNWPWNMGRNSGPENHWNVCFRLQFFVGSYMEPTLNGVMQDHLYQVLCSIGNPKAGSPVLEARLTNFGPQGLQIYFRLPDGTFLLIPHTLVVGRWYNAIIGIEAPPFVVGNSAESARTHRVYFRYLDADLAPGGAFSAEYLMKRTTGDPATDYIVSFGASVRGTANQGVGDNNHAMIGVSCVGIGHHPAHLLSAGVAPTLLLSEINPLISFSELEDAEGCAPLITGQDGGCTLTQGSRACVVASSEPIPSYLKRFPIRIAHAILEIVRKAEATQTVPNSLVIQTVAGSTANLFSAHQGATLKGAELRAQVWAAYTNLTTVEPGYDTDLNAGTDKDSSWALTKDVFSNIAGGVLHFYIAVDPSYEYVSPLRIFPTWDTGIVTRLDNRIEVLKQYKLADGKATILAIANGCLYDVDERWRKGGPFSPNDFGFQIRSKPDSDQRERMRRRDEAALLSRTNVAFRNEAIRWGSEFSITAGVEFACIEIDVWLDTLEGRQTLSAAVQKVYQSVGGVMQMKWLKNHHFYINDGDVAFESGNEVTGNFLKCRTVGNCSLNINEWIRLQIELKMNALTPNLVIDSVIRVNGRQVPTANTVGPLGYDDTMMPPSSDNSSYLGACGHPTSVPFVDPLRGKIGGFAYRLSDDNYSYKGQDYEVCRVDSEPGQFIIPMTDGVGVHFFLNTQVQATFIGDVALPVGHGMGQLPDQESSITVFGDIAYVNTGFTRPWRYDFESFTPAGLRAPVGRLASVTPTRIPLRVQNYGADHPPNIGRLNGTQLQTLSPHVLGFTGSFPTPVEGDVGALVYVPSDHQMGSATDFPCGYIGTVIGINTAVPGYVMANAPFAEQLCAALSESAWMLFRTTLAAGGSYKQAIKLLKSTAPWSERRLLGDGKNNNSAPQTEALVEGPTSKGCLHFRGNVYFESGPWASSTLPLERGKVVSAKGYIKMDVPLSTGDDQVLWEMAKDGDSGCFRITVFDGGRLKFEFFDTLLGDFRSIQTCGKVLTPDQWYYLHFRYKFKQSGASVLDTIGGWEPDLRWLMKAGGASVMWKNSDFRDLLQIYACEGLHEINPIDRNADVSAGYLGDVDEGASCAMLQLPGCESQIGGVLNHGAKATHNHSQHLLNVGLLKSAPYLTPEAGDGAFPNAGVSPQAPRSGIFVQTRGVAAGAMYPIGPLFDQGTGNMQVGGDTTPSLPPLSTQSQFLLPNNFVLPRACSMNRDDAWNRRVDFGSMAQGTQISKTNADEKVFRANMNPAITRVGPTQNLASYAVFPAGSSYGKQDCWAVLLRVWSNQAGSLPDLAGGGLGVQGTPRVFAIVHLGGTDLGEPSPGGVTPHTLFVTDDVLYGGDGGGSLKVGGTVSPTGTGWHATIELMNGLNQARNSANRLVWPSLLEHGANPVGVSDSPDQSQCTLRIGGTTASGERGVVRRGFKGYMADVGFLFAPLEPDSTKIYTTDCLPPDAFFTGPKDTRIQSLPRLNFATNALILDDPSGLPAPIATAVYRCTELVGNRLQPDAAFSIQDAPSLFAVTNQSRSVPRKGVHRFWTTYWDRKQRVESNPSEEITVAIEGDDGGGDYLLSELQFNITGVPISGDRREYLSRRIYKSQAEGSLAFLFAQIDDDTTFQVAPRVDELALPFQVQAFFDNGRPPRCKAIFASETNVVYAGIDDAPNVVVISKPFKAEHVPGTKIVFAESGRGGGVVGVSLTRGLIMVSKRNALFMVNTAGAGFRTSRVGHSVGTLSHNSIADCDGVLFFLSQKGVFTFAGNQVAYEASEYIDVLYQTILDARGMWRSAGVHLVDRGQYLAIVKRVADIEPRAILHAEQRFDEFGNREYTWGLIDFGVPFSALGEFEDIDQEAGRVVLGTGTGLIAEYNSGNGIGFNPNVGLGGFAATITNASSTTGKLAVTSASLDTSIAGFYDSLPVMCIEERDALGAPAAVGGVDYAVMARDEILFAAQNFGSTATFLTRKETNWLGLQGKRVYIGAYEWNIRSKRFEAAVGETVKAWDILDLYFDPVPGGLAFLEIYTDMRVGVTARFRIEMDQGFFSIPITTLYFRHIQFRIKGYTKQSRVGFSLHRYNLRGRPQEWAMRQKT